MNMTAHDRPGNYFVSDHNGRVFQVLPSGQKTLLLNTTTPKYYCADNASIFPNKLVDLLGLFVYLFPTGQRPCKGVWCRPTVRAPREIFGPGGPRRRTNEIHTGALQDQDR